ncbi:uncharacterized protein LOC113971636 isoform X2 [Neopelma chrysocephalum]|nr:uncharacterized protein LOC113971636 isoform X2 [Neopelma chrysocephalum]XP_027547559.1 uncharacterized protein LOC113971636 isoform X2 [Neopelma chrysocephalum]
MKVVNIQAIDTLFSDIATTFNRQHEAHSAMLRAAKRLREVCGCAPTAALTACMDTLQQEHGAHGVQVIREGFGFSLAVKEQEVPEELRRVQQQLEALSRSTKGVLAWRTVLQEMTSSVLQGQAELEERIRAANPEYLDQVRLEGNLRENIQKIGLARELSEHYWESASCVLREMAQAAGLVLEESPGNE